MRVLVDPEDVVEESDEKNNERREEFRISAPTQGIQVEGNAASFLSEYYEKKSRLFDNSARSFLAIIKCIVPPSAILTSFSILTTEKPASLSLFKYSSLVQYSLLYFFPGTLISLT
ncbi:MAG: hypothetical protein DRN92_00075 [Thermoproteota archaeon]|nr:MAG: hypothetical protein DRN92_00075 [Candidatus Korarchaeota archaeon]